VGKLGAVGVILLVAAGGADAGVVAELVLNTGADGDWLSLDTLEVFPSEDTFEGVVDAILELLVAADHSEASGQIGAEPVEAVLGVGRLVDDLSEALRDGLGVSLEGKTDVVLAVDLKVDLGLDSDLGLLVVLDIKLGE